MLAVAMKHQETCEAREHRLALARARDKRYREKHPERAREMRAARVRRWRERNPDWRKPYAEQVKAQHAVTNAIRDGRLERLPCEICGEWAEAHHTDYTKPLDVRWLCPAHHREEHGRVQQPLG